MRDLVWADGNLYFGEYDETLKKVVNAVDLCDEGLHFELCPTSAGAWIKANVMNELITVTFDGQKITTRTLKPEEQQAMSLAQSLYARAEREALPKLTISHFDRLLSGKK